MEIEINDLLEMLKEKIKEIDNIDEKIKVINTCKKALHEVSPFANEPVDCVLWVEMDNVSANSWNPNAVAPPEMRLLYDSIKCDGFTQPIVASNIKDNEYEVVDGFHRNRIGKEHKDIRKKLLGYLPIVNLQREISERMASTIRHNRARGSHDIDLMSNIVLEIHKIGRSDEWIAKHLGMDLDEILRLKQITGLAEAFANNEFSRSWEEG